MRTSPCTIHLSNNIGTKHLPFKPSVHFHRGFKQRPDSPFHHEVKACRSTSFHKPQMIANLHFVQGVYGVKLGIVAEDEGFYKDLPGVGKVMEEVADIPIRFEEGVGISAHVDPTQERMINVGWNPTRGEDTCDSEPDETEQMGNHFQLVSRNGSRGLGGEGAALSWICIVSELGSKCIASSPISSEGDRTIRVSIRSNPK